MKIVVAEKISSAGLKLLAAEPGWTVVTPEDYAASPDTALADADALIVRSAIMADDKLLEKAPRLRVIGRAGVGVDNIEMPSATRRGIVVMNTPGANALAVAELTIGLMLALARHIPRADRTTRVGKWEKKSLQGTEVNGKTLGLVGLGRIGTEVAQRARALGMTVVATDPYISPERARELNVALCPIDDLYGRADYISLHVGLTPQTAGFLNGAAFAKMKPGVRIVNCARGELVDEAALFAALESGQVGAVALDVFATEPPKNSPLLAFDNVVVTPHIGGSTAEAQEAVGTQIALQIREYLLRAVVQNAVNIPSLSDLEYREMRPFMELAEKLGSLLAQLFDGNLEEIRLFYAGAISDWKTELLRSAAIVGVLRQTSSDNVNLVNAATQAQARGLHLSEEKLTESQNDVNLLAVALRNQNTTLEARGTVVRRLAAPRIIELNGIEIESPLDGNLLVIANVDVPGVIGAVGSVLGTNGVNIARFALGREAAQASMAATAGQDTSGDARPTALAMVQTDTPAPASVVDELRRVPGVVSVRSVLL
jgi:D-3-phosphoglycerate dehydrogenase / 2-oxoglutarate reductase